MIFVVLLRGRYDCRVGLANDLAESLVVAEEEGLALQYRAADAGSELILTIFRLNSSWSSRIKKDVLGIELVVAQKLECRTMERVGSGLGDHVGHSACRAARFSRVQAGGHVHFLNGVHGGTDTDNAVKALVVVHAVDHVVVGIVSLSIRGIRRLQAAIGGAISASEGVRVAVDHARRELDQLNEIAPTERDVFDLLWADQSVQV